MSRARSKDRDSKKPGSNKLPGSSWSKDPWRRAAAQAKAREGTSFHEEIDRIVEHPDMELFFRSFDEARAKEGVVNDDRSRGFLLAVLVTRGGPLPEGSYGVERKNRESAAAKVGDAIKALKKVTESNSTSSDWGEAVERVRESLSLPAQPSIFEAISLLEWIEPKLRECSPLWLRDPIVDLHPDNNISGRRGKPPSQKTVLERQLMLHLHSAEKPCYDLIATAVEVVTGEPTTADDVANRWSSFIYQRAK